MRSCLFAAVLVGALTTSASGGQVTPVRGPWKGTATDHDNRAGLTFVVAKVGGHREIHRLRTKTKDTCVAPGTTDPPITVPVDVSFDRVRVKRDGSFARNDGDVDIRGRFTGPRRVTGTIDVAPDGLTCSGSTLKIVARAQRG